MKADTPQEVRPEELFHRVMSPLRCGIHCNSNLGRLNMLSWALTFLVIALVAGLMGFGGLAGEAAWVAHTLFVVFLILFVVSAITGRRTPSV